MVSRSSVVKALLRIRGKTARDGDTAQRFLNRRFPNCYNETEKGRGWCWRALVFCSPFVIAAALFAGHVHAAETAPAYTSVSKSTLQELVSPIALYPDQLLQVILPAATFPDQIVDAGLLITKAEDATLIKDQAWDDSVKLVATYPGVLSMMFQKMDWTTKLGNAFLYQHEDLLGAIQARRTQAISVGNLASNEQQTVKTEKSEAGANVIVVQPTNPQVIYVPQSAPTVYTQPSTSPASSALVPLASFGLGMALGSAMNNDNDDNHYYYYGGSGGMWHSNDNFNKWSDNRRAVWEDYNDRAWDKQDHRQDMASERQGFRQDMYEQGKVPAQNPAQREQMQKQAQQRAQNNPQAASRMQQAQAAGGANSAQRQQLQQQAQQRQQQAGGGSFSRSNVPAQRTQSADAQARRTQAQSSLNSGSLSSTSRPTSAQRQQARQRASSSGYSGTGGAFNSYGNRGSTTSASSRGAASRSTMSGGGGGFRGGGGGRRR